MDVGMMMTIGQFAEQTGLSISALRFYADRQLLVPAQIDSSNGYRRYTQAQVADGVFVRDLRLLDMSLSDISDALPKSTSDRKVMITHHLAELERIVMRARTIAQHLGVTAPIKETTMSTTLQAQDLALALDQVLPAAGTDPEMPHLMTVLIEGKDGSVRLVATDRYRLAIRDLVPLRLGANFAAVVPAASLAQWRGLLNGTGEITMTFAEGTVSATGLGEQLIAQVVPATFPEYEPFLIRAKNVTSVQVESSRLLAALETFEGDDTVVLTTTSDQLLLTRGDEIVRVEASCSGAEQRVGISPRFAAEAAKHALGNELVVEFEDAVRPVVFRSASDGTYTSRVMPVKLD